MATECELALQKAKTNFTQSVSEFAPIKFIEQHPCAALAIAIAAGSVLGLVKLPKIKRFLPHVHVLSFLKSLL